MTTQNVSPHFDQGKAEEFAGRLLATLNDGALCLMLSIGHRTGLFDVLREFPPATSEQIAALAGLAERYVREWLGAMVTARIIELDPVTQCFSLPTEHATFLTRAAVADNMAVFAQYIAVLGSVEDDIVACFKGGGGVPYSKFVRFDLSAEAIGHAQADALRAGHKNVDFVVADLTDSIGPPSPKPSTLSPPSMRSTIKRNR